jgi:hypothetical protein
MSGRGAGEIKYEKSKIKDQKSKIQQQRALFLTFGR